MMSDLTERLRKASFQEWQEYPSAHIEGAKWPVASDIGKEAADEIDRLTAALAEARDKALEDAAKQVDYSVIANREPTTDYIRGRYDISRAIAARLRALKEKP